MTEPGSENTIVSEQVRPRNYLRFEHQGNTYTVQRAPIIDYKGDIVQSTTQNAEIASLSILSSDGVLHGEIGGEFIKDDSGQEIEFHSGNMTNKKIRAFSKVQKGSDHISGLVRECIAQILIQGKVQKWISSDVLLNGGEITYDRLLLDPRITGMRTRLPIPNDDGSPRYQYSLYKR